MAGMEVITIGSVAEGRLVHYLESGKKISNADKANHATLITLLSDESFPGKVSRQA